MSDGYKPKQSGGFGGAPFTTGAIRQWYHHRLQFLARDFEFADALKFHRLAGQVFLWRYRISKYIQKKGPGTRCVNSERDYISHDRL